MTSNQQLSGRSAAAIDANHHNRVMQAQQAARDPGATAAETKQLFGITLQPVPEPARPPGPAAADVGRELLDQCVS